MNPDFFYRFECFDLVPGNKTAGFVMHVSTEALKRLCEATATAEERKHLLSLQAERVGNSGLVAPDEQESCGMAFYGSSSACPLMFTTDPTLGGSLGANPQELARLAEGHGEEYFGPSIEYAPHNVDSPAQAMVLMILALAWAEWAHTKLVRLAREDAKNPKLKPLPAYGDHMTLETFREHEDMGGLLSCDGDGYYATETGMSDIRTTEAQPEWATHVVWFSV